MKRLTFAFFVALAVLGTANATIFAQGAGGTEGERVLVVTYPATRWADVEEHRPPVLLDLLAQSAVGSMSVRTIGPTTSPGEAYATIGAGNRAAAEDAFAGLALPPPAAVEGDAAIQVFERRCGCSSEAASVLHLGMPRVQRSNDRLLYGAEPGALGQALADAGIGVAVVGNADVAASAVGDDVHREVALAAVDHEGRVPFGSVGPQLVVKDPSAPFGVRSDTDALAATVEASWERAGVVVLEMSDLERVERYADLATEEATEEARGRALEAADAVLERVLAGLDLERDTVIVVGPTAPRGPSQLTIAAVAGPGFDGGELRSATTRRAGYVTLPDVAPTVLDALGVDLPDDMTGTAMTSVDGGRPSPSALADENEAAIFRDEATGPASVTFIVFQVLSYGLAALALTRFPRAKPWAGFMALMTLAMPPLAFLSGLVPYRHLGVVGYVVALLAASAVLAALALTTVKRGPLVPPLLLVGLSLAVLVGDIATGGHLQLNTVFGYSPIVAGRFAGFGNLAFALVGATAVVLATGAWGAAQLEGGRPWALGGAAALLVLVIVVDGLPSLGSDVGGVLAMVPATAVVLLLLTGRRIDGWKAAIIAAASVATLALFALVDLARDEADRTHLGRLAARVLDDGGGGAGTVIQRKIESNISILTSSVWTWIIPFAVLYLGFVVWRRPGFLRALEERTPGLRACLVGSLVVGALGFALNDSGVAVPAMMLGVVLPYVTFLAVRTS